jgi:hypothetical protein
MSDAKTDAVVVVDKSEAEDPERRNLALALLGAIGGASFLQACAPVDGNGPQQLSEMAQALSGNGTLKVVDNVTNLRALTGGTTLWIAVMQGYSAAGDAGGGVFYWSTTAKADDGWLVLNAGSGNSAGWRRVNPGFMEFDNVTALRATSGTTKGVAVLLGYSTVGDGGGGTFYWSTTAAQDDGGTVLNSGSGNSAGWRRIYSGPLDIRWFGANVASTTNETAINAAINLAIARNGGRVYIPEGVWQISNTVLVTSPGVQIDSVVLEGVPSISRTKGSWLKWVGSASPATMVKFQDCFSCGAIGIGLDGNRDGAPGGGAEKGLFVTATGGGRSAANNFFEKIAVTSVKFDPNPSTPNPATYSAVHVGAPGLSTDIHSNRFVDLTIDVCTTGVFLQGSQTVNTVFDRGVFTNYVWGMYLTDGEINVSNMNFGSPVAGNGYSIVTQADVYVAMSAQYARFYNNYHECRQGMAYSFEPWSTGKNRTTFTLLSGVRVAFKATNPGTTILDFRQNGHLTLLSCEFDGDGHSPNAFVFLAPPTSVGLANVQQLGCNYMGNAFVNIGTGSGGWQSISGDTNVQPDPAPGADYADPPAEQYLATMKLRLHNSVLRFQDNNAGSLLGYNMRSTNGTLNIVYTDATEPPATQSLFVLGTAASTKFYITADGGIHVNNLATVTSGTGAPPTSPTPLNGSLYLRIDGSSPNLYVYQGGWVAVK